MTAKDRHFDIDASIVFQLGEGLISDSVQAVVELIKNCWDADSTRAKITVNTKDCPEGMGSYYEKSRGYIVIEDDGTGMSESDIINGWLLISNSAKREQKAKGKKTDRGRTPLGEKGLGRLGVQRLGDNIEIITESENAKNRYHVGWSWSDFKDKKRLSQLQPKWKTRKAEGRKGTKLLITGLQDISSWEDRDTLETFRDRLSQMISPYSQFEKFRINAIVNKKRLELADISEKIRSLATLRYTIDFDGEYMTINGRMRLDYIRPSKRAAAEDKQDFIDLVVEDKGEALFDYLKSLKDDSVFELKRERRAGWFCRYQTKIELSQIDKFHQLNGHFANPGPFSAEIDNYSLEEDESKAVFKEASTVKQFVKAFNGIRVFRDGFGVRTDEDWLGLGKSFTKGSSFYALRPANVMGFVAISAEHNQALREATDREGFIRTAEYENFLLLFSRFAKYAEMAQEFVRRGYNEYRKQHARQQADLPETAAADEVARTIVASVGKSAQLGKQLNQVEQGVVANAIHDAQALSETLSSTPSQAEINKSLSKIDGIHQALESTGLKLREIRGELDDLSKLTGQAKLLLHQVETLQYQMSEAASTISLGLTAEALSHEVANVADRLFEKTADISKYISRAKVTDERVIGFAEHVRAAVNALRKEMSHLAPSLRFARERRQVINVREFLEDLSGYHNDRLADKGVAVVVRGDKIGFSVRMNAGKLTQVIDNLVINSEYWVKEALRTGAAERGTITIRIVEPYIKISDSGLGVDPHIEPVLFQPFNSSRKNGRGLGLFIVQQLLENDGCSISVAPKRNDAGRLHQFVIDLTGVLHAEG